MKPVVTRGVKNGQNSRMVGMTLEMHEALL